MKKISFLNSFSLISKGFNKKVFTLVIGTVLSQSITIISAPIASRIFSPEDFGLFAFFVGITSIVSTAICFRYDIAIIQPKSFLNSFRVALISFYIMIFMFLIIAAVVLFFGSQLSKLSGLDLTVILLITLTSFFNGLFNILLNLNLKMEKIRRISITKVMKSAMQNLVPIVLSFLIVSKINLILGYIFSLLLSCFYLVRLLNFKKKMKELLNFKKLKFLILKYKKFPLYNLPASLADAATLQLPIIFIFYIGGELANGLFFFASRLISIPMSLIGQSFSQIFYNEISLKVNGNSQVIPFLKSSAKKLFLIGFPCFLLIFFCSPIAFPFVFSEKWAESGLIAQYLSFSFFATFMASPLSHFLSIEKYVVRGAMWKYLYFLTSLLLFWSSYYFNLEFYNFLLIFTVHEVLIYMIYFILIFKTGYENDKKLLML